ncbi:MAG: hypothetical protein R3B70_21605 [Polyangiaceae bacterium]
MRRARSGLVPLLAVGLCACGPVVATTPTPAGPVEIAPPAAPTAPAKVAGPDLSAVEEPADIVGFGRWRSPLTTVSNLASCSGVAPVVVEVNARAAVEEVLGDFIRGGVDVEKLSGVIALDAPLDVLVTLDPDERPRPPRVAFSLGLTSLDDARIAVDREGKMQETSPGMWRLRNTRGAACVIAASAGATSARLVCADREKTLAAVAPYLARSAPLLDLGGPDVHVEARIATLEKRYGMAFRKMLRVLPDSLSAELGTGNARFDGLLFESGVALQGEVSNLLADVQRVQVEAKSASSGTCLRATADLDLGTKTSWLAQTLTDRPDRSGPPPALYWRQPKDADLAFYGRGVDAAQFTGLIARMRSLLDASLNEAGMSSGDRKKITDLIALPYGKDTSTVVSHGAVGAAYPQAGTKDVEKKVIEAGFTRMMGWTVIGMDEGPATAKAQLKALVDAYKAAGVQATMKKAAGSEAKYLPTVKSQRAPASLGAGAEALEITFPNIEVPNPAGYGGPPRKQTTSFKVHLMLMSDADTTWIGFGADKSEVEKHLAATRSSAGDAGQLASRSDLGPLRDGKQMFAGFLSGAPFSQRMSSFITGLETVEPGGTPGYIQGLSQALTSLPNGAKTPLFLSTNVTPSPSSTRLSLAIDVQKGTFEDAKSLVLSAYSFFARMGIVP